SHQAVHLEDLLVLEPQRLVVECDGHVLSPFSSVGRRPPPAEAPDLFQPPLRQPDGGGVRCDPLFRGGAEDLQGGVVDRVDSVHGTALRVAVELVVDIDQAPGVHDEVGGVEDAFGGQPVAVLFGGELVVGGPDDSLAPQAGDGVCVEHGTQRTRREDVAGGRDGVVGVDGLDAVVLDRSLDGGGLGVGHYHLGPGFHEQLDEGASDFAHSLDDDLATFQVGSAPQVLGGGFGGGEQAAGRHRGGVARTPLCHRQADGPAGLAADQGHVGGGGADVLGGDVAAAQRIDQLPERPQEALGLVRGGVADDHRLATTQIQAGGCRLVGHPLGQAEHVDEGLFFRGLRIKTGPAEGGTQSRGVDGDDRLEARYGIGAEYDLLVTFSGYVLEDTQRVVLSSLSPVVPPPGAECTPVALVETGCSCILV